MKRLLLAFAAALAVLLVILLLRTLLLEPARLSSAAVELPPGIDAQRAAERLGEAIRFETISHQVGAGSARLAESHAAFSGMHQWLTRSYPQFSAATRREQFADSLLFTWPGSDPQLLPVLLMAHFDVVPVVPGSEAQWTRPPFSGTVVDGYVWGRGAIDSKGSAIAMLEAAETLLEQGFQPQRTVLFAFGHDEEIGGYQGNRQIAEHLQQQGVRLAWVADEGGFLTQGMIPGVDANVAVVGIAEKGYLSLTLEASAIGGHSSFPPPFNETAIGRLSRALQRIEARPFARGLDGPTGNFLAELAPAQPFASRMAMANLWLFGPLVEQQLAATPSGAAQLQTVISPTLINAGIKDNVLPPSARAVVNLRIHPRDSIESAVEHVRQAVNDPQISIRPMPAPKEPSAVSNVDGAAYRYFTETIRASFDTTLVLPNLTVGGTDSRHYLPLTENVFRFIPIRMGPQDMQRFHGNDERVAISNMGEAAGFYYRLLRGMPVED
jgi:carboxypeptidase PM20D1